MHKQTIIATLAMAACVAGCGRQIPEPVIAAPPRIDTQQPATCPTWHRLTERVDWTLKRCDTRLPGAWQPPPMRYSTNTWNVESAGGELRALEGAPWQKPAPSDGS